ncbi:hypothetical protein K9U39_12885 [Rhodoblastus acidophilus]|uniref:Uncharacterized protein n=1 Tax=Candidatus Rhodoblastus alkanivorans TaxID=2954117 RepID=A0ABS9Z9Z0_9HYPH|nr:hypothetical protein [Candidatus Rhodoblastus alkanivorans]MCI4677152.1 hypothetical protein [Candidatus Rhodoblastus alkanivorans]MCI4684505.1 hypothetical protein [Candidatus Rhodoblastus alkanivorans]MDI4641826.1 hypothetical protein [Rhodoblastus acidophilus]
MSASRLLRLAAPILVALGCGPARAQDISPQALTHYAYCIEQAQQYGFVFQGQRGIAYRCRDEVAVAYFNDLGRQRRRAVDRIERNATGVYDLRAIRDVGFCWHKIENELRQPVSFWGCDIYVAF